MCVSGVGVWASANIFAELRMCGGVHGQLTTAHMSIPGIPCVNVYQQTRTLEARMSMSVQYDYLVQVIESAFGGLSCRKGCICLSVRIRNQFICMSTSLCVNVWTFLVAMFLTVRPHSE